MDILVIILNHENPPTNACGCGLPYNSTQIEQTEWIHTINTIQSVHNLLRFLSLSFSQRTEIFFCFLFCLFFLKKKFGFISCFSFHSFVKSSRIQLPSPWQLKSLIRGKRTNLLLLNYNKLYLLLVSWCLYLSIYLFYVEKDNKLTIEVHRWLNTKTNLAGLFFWRGF